MTGNNNSDTDDESSSSSDMGEQIRVTLTLASECPDRELEVPSHPMSVPATITNKGFSVLLNHLLERTTDSEESPALPFEFIVGKNHNRLLRTGVEREARRSGLSLEEAVPIVYFPATREPELDQSNEPLPDWVSALSCVSTTGSDKESSFVVAGSYDGSVHVLSGDGKVLEPLVQQDKLHAGAIKCLASTTSPSSSDVKCWVATGSMDHTLVVSRLVQKKQQYSLEQYASCSGGHVSSIGSVDWFPSTLWLASGDWDGGICIWDCKQEPEQEMEHPTGKRSKIHTGMLQISTPNSVLAPKISIQAHVSKVSGISWGNLEKRRDITPSQLVTGSWDHSVKVWDVETQDCVLTLNGSRVVSCLDTSYKAAGIVAMGHPDCTIRLWDVRSADSKQSSLSITDNTFRPSHQEWITSVKWSPENAYHLTSTSHDGTVKFWDIRSSVPLYTVRAFPKEQKGLSLAYGNDGMVYAGGTDCVVKQFHPSNKKM
jgi:ribosome biogenesis protein YTM1